MFYGKSIQNFPKWARFSRSLTGVRWGFVVARACLRGEMEVTTAWQAKILRNHSRVDRGYISLHTTIPVLCAVISPQGRQERAGLFPSLLPLDRCDVAGRNPTFSHQFIDACMVSLLWLRIKGALQYYHVPLSTPNEMLI